MQKPNQEEFRIEKVIKRKGDKIYVKWKGYDNSFNSWIDKKRPSKYIKKVNLFLNHMSLLEEILMSELIYLIMQQRLI